MVRPLILGATAFGMQLLNLGMAYLEAREATKPLHKRITTWMQVGMGVAAPAIAHFVVKTPEAMDVAAIISGSTFGRLAAKVIQKAAPPTPAASVSIPRLTEEPIIRGSPIEEEEKKKVVSEHPMIATAGRCKCSQAVV